MIWTALGSTRRHGGGRAAAAARGGRGGRGARGGRGRHRGIRQTGQRPVTFRREFNTVRRQFGMCWALIRPTLLPVLPTRPATGLALQREGPKPFPRSTKNLRHSWPEPNMLLKRHTLNCSDTIEGVVNA